MSTSLEDVQRFLTHALEDGVSAFKRGEMQTVEDQLGPIVHLAKIFASAMMYRGMTHARCGLRDSAVDHLEKSSFLDASCQNEIQREGYNNYVNGFFGNRKLFAQTGEAIHDPGKQAWGVSRWPNEELSIKNTDELKKAIYEYIVPSVAMYPPFIDKTSSVVTLGSCFAQHIGRALLNRGIRVNVNNFNDAATNTFAIRHFFDWLETGGGNKFTNWFQVMHGEEIRQEAVNDLMACDALILTFGVAPCLFNERSGEFAFTKPHADKTNFPYDEGNYALRTTTVQENADNMLDIIRCVRRLNKSCRIVISVSPVPLWGTNEFPSVVVADCLSKSTIRLAVHQVVSQTEGTIYWPSFEIVRWFGGHSDFKMYGADDGESRHVNMSVVGAIMDSFLDVFMKHESPP
jgi:hypothetical protein